ncbi:MAG: tetratricopeptide repeat protein [Flavobacteriaceae bacterium]
MKLAVSVLILWMFPMNVLAQTNFKNKAGDSHLCGPFPIERLEKDSLYQSWFTKGYNADEYPKDQPKWAKELSKVEIEIFMGTWCGDSKKWVPRFVRLWDEIGLSRSQLSFIGLYDFTDGKYKQGPNAEEQGREIHRIPTFIIKRKGREIARIVESPVEGLQSDLEKIALGQHYIPNYRAANYLMKKFKKNVPKKKRDAEKLKTKLASLTKNHRELNTLGFVYLDAGKEDKALKTFKYNSLIFKNNPDTFINYAYALTKLGKIEEAIENYRKVLELDKDNTYATRQLEQLEQTNKE